MEHLVQLLSCGHVLPVVDYVAHCMEMESLDQSHIRHFVAEVCKIVIYIVQGCIPYNIANYFDGGEHREFPHPWRLTTALLHWGGEL